MNQSDAMMVMVAASLVFFMQAGFATREAGLTRSKNAINVASKILVGTLVGALVFWAWGFGFMEGAGGEWLGTSDFLLGGDARAKLPAFFLRLAFGCAALSILSGAVAERMRLGPYLVTTVLFMGFIYPIFGRLALHGLIARQGFVDAAGATWVHSLGGWMALAGALAVGPRAGRFVDGRKPVKIPGASIPLAVLGTFILWLGMIGGNAAASGSPDGLPHVVANTMIAGGAGGTVALVVGWALRRKPEVELPMMGVLAGLVAISAGSSAVTLPAALIIGAVAGGVSLLVDALLLRGKLDDAVGAIPIHLGGGVWGTLALALFAAPAGIAGDGLADGVSRSGQLKAQIEGVLAAGIIGFGASFFMLKLVAVLGKLRVDGPDEDAGLNVVEHDAHSELTDLLDTMEDQAQTGDMTLRAPVEPFTEIGAIAKQYNRVMETLEFTTAQTESLVRTSLDALITFNTEGIITSSNPAASAIFGYGEREFRAVAVTSLFAPSRDKTKGRADLATLLKMFVGQTREVRGQRRSGEEFTMETSFNYVSVGEDEIYTATYRDITQRKETEAELNRAQAEIRRRLEQELEDAKVVQRALLPVETQFPNCEIARHYQAASETGGDWFGIHYYPETQSVTLYIGDVTGHGLPAALMSGVVCGAVYSSEYTQGALASPPGGAGRGERLDAQRDAQRDVTTPPGAPSSYQPSHIERQLRTIADVVNRIVLQTGKGELLMTMGFMHVNLRTGALSFLNAGHNMPWVVKGAGGPGGAPGSQVSNLVSRGSRLGEKDRPEFEVVHTKLDPGDVVVLYTDGLIENQGPDGKVLSVRDVKNVLTTKHSAAEIRDELVARAKAVWQDRPASDDHSILVFRWTPQQRAQSGHQSVKSA
jgi:ammonium transporter, Amt family